MDCLPVPKLPAGPHWTYEIKLDGYRLEVVRSGGKTTLYSRRQNVLTQRFPYIAAALEGLPAGTVIDGELVALGPDGRPDFNLLQNFRSAESRIIYYAFDILIHKDHDLMALPLSERRAILGSVIEPSEHVALSEVSDRSAAEMVKFVKSHGLEGAVANASRMREVTDNEFSGVCPSTPLIVHMDCVRFARDSAACCVVTRPC
jgi:bifunctional non-homologous end joining protein LigD